MVLAQLYIYIYIYISVLVQRPTYLFLFRCKPIIVGCWRLQGIFKGAGNCDGIFDTDQTRINCLVMRSLESNAIRLKVSLVSLTVCVFKYHNYSFFYILITYSTFIYTVYCHMISILLIFKLLRYINAWLLGFCLRASMLTQICIINTITCIYCSNSST